MIKKNENMLYQILDKQEDAERLNDNINILFAYPIGSKTATGKIRDDIKTIRYRLFFKHPTENLWAVPIGIYLENACLNMDITTRLNYYDADNLKDIEYLKKHGWYNNIPF